MNNEIIKLEECKRVKPVDRLERKDYKSAEEMQLLPEASANYSKIVDALKVIDGEIDKGDEQTKKVLDNHEKQFLLAYRTHMMNIYKEINELQQKSSESAAENMKITHRYRVEEALRFFKEETLRLSKIYKQNEAEIEKLKKTAETREFDKKFLEMQLEKKRAKIETLKSDVNVTASLFQKLIHNDNSEARPRKSPLEMPKRRMEASDFRKPIEDFMIKLMEVAESDEEIISEVEQYFQLYLKETEKELRQLRSELEYEKSKYHQTRNQFLNKITNRSELETFFFECLGEMRKEILHRGPRSLVSEMEAAKPGSSQFPKLDPGRYQALQAILSNDRILISLFDEIFGPPTKKEEFPMLFPKAMPPQARDLGRKATNITSPDYQDLHSYLDFFPPDS